MDTQLTGFKQAFMQQVLSPEEFDALRPKILQIPGFTHDGVRENVILPMWPAHEVVRRLPQDLMKRRKYRYPEASGLDWRMYTG